MGHVCTAFSTKTYGTEGVHVVENRQKGTQMRAGTTKRTSTLGSYVVVLCFCP